MTALIQTLLPILQKYALPVLGALFALFGARQAGKNSIINKENRANLKTSQAMAKAEANKPASQEALLNRLDKGDA